MLLLQPAKNIVIYSALGYKASIMQQALRRHKEIIYKRVGAFALPELAVS